MYRIRIVLLPLLFAGLVFPLAAACADDGGNDDPLFGPIEPYKTGHLKVSDLHEIYYECSGNPEGLPVIGLHGGPGVGCYPRMRQYFDPDKFNIVLHDQRGSARSRPWGELRENTTPNLVEDIERLRKHLNLGKVFVFAGSWGTTLGLAYAEAYPDNVRAMVLRGVFTATREEVEQHYMGAAWYFPEEHDALMRLLPDPDRRPLPDYVLELVNNAPDLPEKMKYLNALARLEIKMSHLYMPDEDVTRMLDGYPDDAHLLLAGIDLHYVTNRYFMKEGQLLENAHKIEHIPTTMIVGRYDMASPPLGAYRIHKRLSRSKLIIVEKAGHVESEEGITAALVKAVAAWE